MTIDVNTLLAAAPFARQAAYDGTSGAQRLANAKIIVEEFLAAGLGLDAALAAVVNANFESNLSARAVGDSGHSVGLFQLNDLGGGKRIALPRQPNGQPQPQDPRFDPVNNTREIIKEYRDALPQFASKLPQGTVAEHAGLFAYYVERPYDRAGEQTRRTEGAHKLFPGVASLSNAVVRQAGIVGVSAVTTAAGAVEGALPAPFRGGGPSMTAVKVVVIVGIVALLTTAIVGGATARRRRRTR